MFILKDYSQTNINPKKGGAIIFYLSYMFIDIFKGSRELNINYLNFLSIILCFLITLLPKEKEINKLDTRLLQFGMFFTVIADLFLVILDFYILGVLVFCIVQMIYITRYMGGRSSHIIKRLVLVFILVYIIYLLTNQFIFKLDFLMVAGFFYLISILTSIFKSIEAGQNIYPPTNRKIIIWGMILFALCDLNVALYNLNLWSKTSFILIWVFYLPSQILLSLSNIDFAG